MAPQWLHRLWTFLSGDDRRTGIHRPSERGTNPRATTTTTRQKKRGTRAGDSVTDRVSCARRPHRGGRAAQGRAQAATGNGVPAVSALWVTNVVDVCRVVVADARKSDDWAPVAPFPSVGGAAGALLSAAVSWSRKDCGTHSDFFNGPPKDNADRVFSLFFLFISSGVKPKRRGLFFLLVGALVPVAHRGRSGLIRATRRHKNMACAQSLPSGKNIQWQMEKKRNSYEWSGRRLACVPKGNQTNKKEQERSEEPA